MTENDEQAYMRQLVDAQKELCLLVASALPLSLQEVEDVVQQTNYALLKSKDKFTPGQPFHPWLVAFAKNQVRAFKLQKARSRLVLDEDVLEHCVDVSAEDSERSEERYRRLDTCCKKLDKNQKRLLTDRYERNKPIVQIARERKASAGTVRYLLFQIRQKLRDCIERMCRLEGEPPPAFTEKERAVVDLLDGGSCALPEVSALFRASPDAVRLWVEQREIDILLRLRARILVSRRWAGLTRDGWRKAVWGAAAAVALALTGSVFLFAVRGIPCVPAGKDSGRVAALPLPVPREKAPSPAKRPSLIREEARGSGRPATEAKRAVPSEILENVGPSQVTDGGQQQVSMPRGGRVSPDRQGTAARKEERLTMKTAASEMTKITAAAVLVTAGNGMVVRQAAAQSNPSNVPIVSNVTFAQPFGSRKMQITYKLENGPAIVTLDITTNQVSIGEEHITYLLGDVNKAVADGTHSIEWDTRHDWPNHTNSQARAVVTAWATNCPPEYMAVYPGTNNVFYFTSAKALPDGGLSNFLYKTSRIVFRKIHAGSFTMGTGSPETYSPQEMPMHTVVFTNDFYLGIYELTQAQYLQTMGGGSPSLFNTTDSPGRPLENCAYNKVRGTSSDGADWPSKGHAVGSSSFLGKLRGRTGLDFDLPTEAQWEYACRAGTVIGYWNDGTPISADANDSGLNELGRYNANGGEINTNADPSGSALYSDPSPACGATNGTAIVGSYRPNAWGLYDMHGNVYEFCLDYFDANYYTNFAATAAVDPEGPRTVSGKVRRGGSWEYGKTYCRAGSRSSFGISVGLKEIGFRIALPLQ